MCSVQRPLDTRSHLRISVEAEAILGLLALCEAGQIDLVSSETLLFETEQNPHLVRKRYALDVLSRAPLFIPTDSRIEEQARIWHNAGIKPVDALHLASAVAGGVDYFCTCDDRFLRQAKAMDTRRTRVVSPLELIAELRQ